MKSKLTFILLTLVTLLAATATASAQDEPPIIAPIHWFPSLRIASQRVDIEIDNQLATTHIEQLFVNDGDLLLEGTYLFPLPKGAAVSQLTMWVDGQAIEAKILPADEAREIYDKIVQQYRDPALLEYVGHDAIQANVFPIPPQSERLIEIEYSHLLTDEQGLFNYVFLQTADEYSNLPIGSQSIRVDIRSDEEIRTVYSPSHKVDVDRRAPSRVVVGFEASDAAPGNDFELFYSVSTEDIALNILSYKEFDDNGYFLLLLRPALEVDAADIVERDVILVLDKSGSMSGEKMVQAQKAATYVVDHLNPGDRYNIIAFSTAVSTFAREMVEVGSGSDYSSYIDRLIPAGGTNVSSALLEAMHITSDERPTTIIFLSDGLATEGIVDTSLLLENVAAQAKPNTRVFAFGIGHDVDTLLLDSMTEAHGGITSYVRPSQPVDEVVSGFFAKMRTPVLTNIELDFGSLRVEEVYPVELQDLFAGTQLIVAGRYREGGRTDISLSGQLNDRTRTFNFENVEFNSRGGTEQVPRIWASRAIGHMLRQIRLHGEDEELIQSIVNLSLDFGIITPYTSYLIEEDDIFTQSGREMAVFTAAEAPMPAQVTGKDAFEMAASESELRDADGAPAAAPLYGGGPEGRSEPVMIIVGTKAFIYRDSTWVDSTYDQENMNPVQIAFASEEYFQLLTDHPDLSQYLSLGPQVIVVSGGTVYEIVDSRVEPGGGALPSEGGQELPTPVADNPGENPATEPTTEPPVQELEIEPLGETEEKDSFPYWIFGIVALAAGAIVVLLRQKR